MRARMVLLKMMVMMTRGEDKPELEIEYHRVQKLETKRWT